MENVENLIKKCVQVRELTIEFESSIEQAFEFFLEELEIQIESSKIELDKTHIKLKKKTKTLNKNLNRLNNEFSEILDDNNLFHDVSLYSMDNTISVLTKFYKNLNSYISNKIFESCTSFTNVKTIGIVPEKVRGPRLITNALLQVINDG
jgi:hypothetical protein